MSEPEAPGKNAADNAAESNVQAGNGRSGKYRIAIVLGVIAVSFYVLSIVSIMFSRGVGG